MNVLFLFCSLGNLETDNGLFGSLIKEFKKRGHNVYVSAKGNGIERTFYAEEAGIPVLRIQSKDFTGVSNMVKKALGYIEYSLKQIHYTKKCFKREKIDIIISHALPPELGVIAPALKRAFKCPFYLINTEFTWQDSVVYGFFKKNSPAGWYYRFLEYALFKASDYIMVPLKGTIDYIKSYHQWISDDKFCVCQFWQQPLNIEKDMSIRDKLGMKDEFVVVYGGSVGQAQRLEHMVNLAVAVKEYKDIHFLLLGRGKKLNDIKQMVAGKALNNFTFLDFMPQQDYLQLLSSCDAGVIILNEVHGSPNFPSKTSSYFNLQVPVLAAIDSITTYGEFLDETNTGLWSLAGDVEHFKENLLNLYQHPELCEVMKKNEIDYFYSRMTPEYAYQTIVDQINHKS